MTALGKKLLTQRKILSRKKSELEVAKEASKAAKAKKRKLEEEVRGKEKKLKTLEEKLDGLNQDLERLKDQIREFHDLDIKQKNDETRRTIYQLAEEIRVLAVEAGEIYNMLNLFVVECLMFIFIID